MSLNILGIETSCDETAIGVVADGRQVRSNVISSQVELHAQYGGVVPEVASRQHVRDLAPVLEKALSGSGLPLEQMDAVAVTYGPGLAGSLITGLNAAKAIAFALDMPLLGDQPPGSPRLRLVAGPGGSGGRPRVSASLPDSLRRPHRPYTDAGPRRLSPAGADPGTTRRGRPSTRRPASWDWDFPADRRFSERRRAPPATTACPRAWMKDTLDFSFSGVKTAMLHLAQDQGLYPQVSEAMSEPEAQEAVRELAGAFQESVVDVLSQKLLDMAGQYGAKGLVLGGGVCGQRPAAPGGGPAFPPSRHRPPAHSVHRQRRDDSRLRLLSVPARAAVPAWTWTLTPA